MDQSIDEKELDEYINRKQVENTLKFYKNVIMRVAILLIGMSLSCIFYYWYFDMVNTKLGEESVKQSLFGLVYQSTCVIICTFFNNQVLIIVPISLFAFLFMAANVGVSNETYEINEWLTPVACLCFLAVITIPNRWKLNSAALVLGFVYYGSQIYLTYGYFPLTFVIISIFSIIYFIAGCWLLYSKLRELYKHIYINELLIKEMRRLLDIFPEGVLIRSRSKDNAQIISYGNDTFKANINTLNGTIDEINKIKVAIKKPIVDGNSDIHDIQATLDQIIQQQENKIKADNQIVSVNIVVLDSDDRSNFEINPLSYETNEAHLCIKTLKLNWEGKSSFMHVFIDTTSVTKLEQASNNIRCQQIMFTNASHEFRTPLNSIINSFEFIKSSAQELSNRVSTQHKEEAKGEDDQKQVSKIEKFIKVGINSSRLLLAMIEDILNLSKFDLNCFTIHKTSFHIRDLTDEVYELFSYQCSQKGIEYSIHIDKQLSDTRVYSDCKRIRQVLINLISNAVKFTFEGFVSLKVHKIEVNGHPRLQFIVEDSGVGIKDEDKKNLFKLFGMIHNSQLDSLISSNGCGLGLTISKKYVEYLCGEILVESEYEKGTIVSFHIPLQIPQSMQLNRREDTILDTDIIIESYEIQESTDVRSITAHAISNSNICATKHKIM